MTAAATAPLGDALTFQIEGANAPKFYFRDDAGIHGQSAAAGAGQLAEVGDILLQRYDSAQAAVDATLETSSGLVSGAGVLASVEPIPAEIDLTAAELANLRQGGKYVCVVPNGERGKRIIDGDPTQLNVFPTDMPVGTPKRVRPGGLLRARKDGPVGVAAKVELVGVTSMKAGTMLCPVFSGGVTGTSIRFLRDMANADVVAGTKIVGRLLRDIEATDFAGNARSAGDVVLALVEWSGDVGFGHKF